MHIFGFIADIPQQLAYAFHPRMVVWNVPDFQQALYYTLLPFRSSAFVYFYLALIGFSYISLFRLVYEIRHGGISSHKVLFLNRVFFGIFGTVLFLPSVELILDSIGYILVKIVDLPGYKQLDYLGYILGYALLFVVFVTPILFNFLLWTDPDPFKKKIFHRTSSRLEFVEVVLKIIFIFPYAMIVPPIEIGLAVYCLCMLVTFILSVLFPSYSSPGTNSFRSGMFLVYTTVGLVGLISKFAKLEGYVPLIIAICCGILAFDVGTMILFYRLQYIVHFQNISTLFPWMILLQKSKTLRDKFIGKEPLSVLLETNQYNVILKRCTHSVDVEVICNVLTSYHSKETNQQALQILTWAAEHTFMDSPYLLTKYIIYLSYMKDNDPYLKMQIKQLMMRVVNLNPSIDTRYIFWYLLNKWELASSAFETGELKKLHILDQFRFHNNMLNARKNHQLALRAALAFWKVSKERSNSVYRLYGIASTFYRHQQLAIWYYKCLVKHFPNSVPALRSFAMFIDECVNNPQISSDIIAYANNIEDRKRIAQQTGTLSNYNNNNQNESKAVERKNSTLSMTDFLKVIPPKQEAKTISGIGSDEDGDDDHTSQASSSHQSGTTTVSDVQDAITDLSELEVDTKRNRKALSKVVTLHQLLHAAFASLFWITCILILVSELVCLNSNINDSMMISALTDTKTMSQLLFLETRKLQVAAASSKANGTYISQIQQNILGTSKRLQQVIINASLYAPFQGNIVKETLGSSEILLSDGDKVSFNGLINAYVSSATALSMKQISPGDLLTVTNDSHFAFLMRDGFDNLLRELSRIMDMYKTILGENIYSRSFLMTTLTFALFVFPLGLLGAFKWKCIFYLRGDAAGIIALLKQIPHRSAKAGFKRFKAATSNTLSQSEQEISDVSRMETASANDSDQLQFGKPEKSRMLKTRFISAVHFLSMVFVFLWLTFLLGVGNLETDVVTRQTAELQVASLRFMYSNRAVALCHELVRADEDLWEDTIQVRTLLRDTLDSLQSSHLALLYGNTSLQLSGSFGRDILQDKLLMTPSCSNLNDTSCYSLDSSVYQFLRNGNLFVQLQEQELSYTHPLLVEMESMISGVYGQQLLQSSQLYRREITSNSGYDMAKVGFVSWFFIMVAIFLILRSPLKLMSRRIKIVRNTLFLLPMEAIIESPELRSYLMHNVLWTEDRMNSEEFSYEGNQKKSGLRRFFGRFLRKRSKEDNPSITEQPRGKEGHDTTAHDSDTMKEKFLDKEANWESAKSVNFMSQLHDTSELKGASKVYFLNSSIDDFNQRFEFTQRRY
jgi:hypothetical protein